MTRHDDGWVISELVSQSIGRRSSVDLCFASIGQQLPVLRDPQGRPKIHAAVTFGTPTALLVSDLLVHRPLLGQVSPTVRTHRSVPGDESPAVAARAQHLKMRETVQSLGAGLAGIASSTADVPRAAQILLDACRRTGWDPVDFDVYRVRVQYPVLGSVVKLKF